MRFKCDFELPSLDLGDYQQKLGEHMEGTIREAARVWLRVASVIPVWSGESKATFRPLADLVQFPLIITPARHALRRPGISNDVGELSADRRRGFYDFEYATDLKHLIYNEFHNANIDPDPTLFSRLRNPGPYHFQRRALVAFQSYARHVRLPDPTKHIRITKLRVR
jgi:hypothetical protein